jgi:hypothetical protein
VSLPAAPVMRTVLIGGRGPALQAASPDLTKFVRIDSKLREIVQDRASEETAKRLKTYY